MPLESLSASVNSFPPPGSDLKITPSRHIKYDIAAIAVRTVDSVIWGNEVA